jgi:uncharacterized membrane protein
MSVKEFLRQIRHDDIIAAVRQAELKTSGEIRVFISHKNVEDAVAAGQADFVRMGMTKTRYRNGVLIFVAPKAHKFAVIGDEAVHQKCGDVFWQALAAEMSGFFKRSEFTQGILHGVAKAGELLAAHFPPQPGDQNELPDQVEHD